MSVRPPADSEHAAIASRLFAWLVLAGWAPDQILQAVGVKLSSPAGDGGRIPDLTVWSAPQRRSVWLPLTDLLLAVEIVSPGSAAMDEVVKVREYADAGIPRGRDLIAHDPLTGLTSRTGLEWGIGRALKRPESVALLLVDLDGFKLINDAYGHAAGDIFLTEFAHHLRSAVRAGQTPARVGGDEFAVVLTDSTVEHATSIARRILSAAAANPVRLENDLVPVRTSIGVAFAQPGDTADTLMRRADVAMYQCKRAGTHAFTVYDPTMVDRRSEDAALSGDLDGALDRGEPSPTLDRH